MKDAQKVVEKREVTLRKQKYSIRKYRFRLPEPETKPETTSETTTLEASMTAAVTRPKTPRVAPTPAPVNVGPSLEPISDDMLTQMSTMERSSSQPIESNNALELSGVPDHVTPAILKFFLESSGAGKGNIIATNIDRATEKAFVIFSDDHGENFSNFGKN